MEDVPIGDYTLPLSQAEILHEGNARHFLECFAIVQFHLRGYTLGMCLGRMDGIGNNPTM